MLENTAMNERKKEMIKFLNSFKNNPERQAKYTELLTLGNNALPFSRLTRKALRRITIIPTTKCNLKCVWCHRNEERFKNYLGKEMPINVLKSILPKLKGFSWLHFGGLGEPLLYPHIFEAIAEAKKYITSVKISTNGTTLTKENCSKLAKAGIDYLEVSIDGFDNSTNAKVRGVHEDKLIENLMNLSNNTDIPIQINMVISDTNYKSLFQAVDKLKHVKNIGSFHTIPLFMTNYMLGLGIKDISPQEHSRLILHWKERCRELNLHIEICPDEEIELDPVRFMKRKHNLCFAVYEDPTINVFAHICPCGRTQEICLDSVISMDFESAWNGPMMAKWRKRQLEGSYPDVCTLECYMKNTNACTGRYKKVEKGSSNE